MPAEARLHTSIFHIKLNGAKLPAEQYARVSEVVVEQSLHLPDMVVIRLHDVGKDMTASPLFSTLDREVYAVGQQIEIGFGREADPVTLMKGEITSVELEVEEKQQPTVTVRGYARSHRLHRGRRIRSFKNMSDSDIASKV